MPRPSTPPQAKLGELPVQVTCPTGGHQITTRVHYESGTMTWVLACVLCFLLGPWGAECAGVTTGGMWSWEISHLHINYKELLGYSASVQCGAVRFTSLNKTLSLFQMETRPWSYSHRCNVPGLETSQRVCVPSILPHRQICLSKIHRKEVPEVPLIAPLWPAQIWFPQILRMLVKHPVLLPNVPHLLTSSHREPHPLIIREQMQLVECVRSTFPSAGFSEEAISLLCASWRQNAEASYNSAWKQWCKWCESRHINPLSESVTEITEFLTQEFRIGKQYSTINSYRSAISVTHS